MKARLWFLVIVMVAAFGAVGCSSDCDTFCEKIDECTTGSFDVDECVDECNDGVDDGRIDEDVLSECACCYADNSCGDIFEGDCDSACGTSLGGLTYTPAE